MKSMKAASRRKQCTHPGCRKLQQPGKDTCEAHGPNGVKKARMAEDDRPVLDAIIRMTEIERLNLVKVETECVNFILQIRNHDLETEEVKRKFTEQLHSRSTLRTQLMTMAEAKKNEQQLTVKEISEKYKMDPQRMTYDGESGVIRELAKES